jgi:hypothetical protein
MLPLSQTLSHKPIYFCYSAPHVELTACLTDYSGLELQWENVLQNIKKHHDRENKLLRCLWLSLGDLSCGLRTWWLENQMMFSTFQGWRVVLCVGNLCDWEFQVSVLYSQTSNLAAWEPQSLCPLFSTLIPTYFSLLLLWPSSSRCRCLFFHSTPA